MNWTRLINLIVESNRQIPFNALRLDHAGRNPNVEICAAHVLGDVFTANLNTSRLK